MVIWLTALLTRTHFFWHVGKQRSALRLSWQFTTFTAFGKGQRFRTWRYIHGCVRTIGLITELVLWVNLMVFSFEPAVTSRGHAVTATSFLFRSPKPPTMLVQRLEHGGFHPLPDSFVFDSRPVFCHPRALASACWMFSPRTRSSDRPVVHVSRDSSGISNRNEERNYFWELELDDIYTVKSEDVLSSYKFV